MPDRTAVYNKNFRREDFQPGPRTMTIKGESLEELQGQDGRKDKKSRITFLEDDRGVILNKTRYTDVSSIAGSPDTDKWVGVKIEVYYDPTVRNPDGKRGGIGIRAPK